MGEVQGELQGRGGETRRRLGRAGAGKLLAPPWASLFRLGGLGYNRAVGLDKLPHADDGRSAVLCH